MKLQDALPGSSNWSKRGQYQITKRHNGTTHCLWVEIDWKEVSIELGVDRMALHTNWEFNGVNEVNVELAADRMTLRTAW